MVFARFFHAFEAACLVMSGIGVGLSSSFLWASEGDVRQFFGGWFLNRLGLNPAGVWAVSAPCRTEAGAATEAAIAAPSTAPSTTWFLHSFSCFRSCLPGDVRHWRWPSSSFLWASEGDVRQFFGGWFLDRLGLNPAGVWAVSAPCRTEAGAATEAAIAAPSTAPSTTWFLHSFFHAFEAACLVMSGIGVGLLHLSCGRQKATLGSFSGAGFWTGWA